MEILDLVKEEGVVNMIENYVKELEKGKLYILREKLIEKYKGDWSEISLFEELSEDFIREFQDKVNWGYISYHNYSEDFIREFMDKII